MTNLSIINVNMIPKHQIQATHMISNVKKTIAVFMSNAIADHEMIFETKHTSSIISGSNWQNVKHTELQLNFPVCLLKKNIQNSQIHIQDPVKNLCWVILQKKIHYRCQAQSYKHIQAPIVRQESTCSKQHKRLMRWTSLKLTKDTGGMPVYVVFSSYS